MVQSFNILGFQDMKEKRVLLFMLLLSIYLLTFSSNMLIMIITKFDTILQNPMFFLLGNLSVLDICYISATVPNMLVILASQQNTISFVACVVQLFSVIFLESAECFLLAIMAYDRYAAICKPLHYILIMSREFCYSLLSMVIIAAVLHSLLHTLLIVHLPFCDNKINHLFCDIPPLLKLSCTDTSLNEIILFAVSGVFVGLGPLLFIFLSYIYIACTIFKITSKAGLRKAFSTCASHLIIVFIFYGSGSFTYIRPKASYSLERDKLLSLFYNIVTPLANPIVYSLRNTEVQTALRKLFRTCQR
ncbi:hypothetical protein XENTR_v10002114 [Xenopus tropicalis]|nr:hypothetical protein XENTR_v10002114 [Xenopus tropicalis]